jgi:tetratricopeptide (TPR) repeat protein
MRIGYRLHSTMLRSRALVLALLLALSSALPLQGAFAQPADLAVICTGRAQATADEKIRACSSLIDAPDGDSERRAVLYTSRGAAWRQKGDFDHALADQDEAIRLQPDSALLYFNRAITWRSKEDANRTIADFGEAIRRAPGFALAYRSRGDQLYAKADYTGAIRDYDTAISLTARDPRALTMRGLAKWQLGDGNAGKADIAAAMRIDVVIAVALVGQAQPERTAGAAKTADCSLAETHWKSVEQIKTVEAYKDHLARFPDCAFATLAKARIASLDQKTHPAATPNFPGKRCRPGFIPDSDGDCVRRKTSKSASARTRPLPAAPERSTGGTLDCTNPAGLFACANRALGTLPH